jgi:hypothetical protein
MRSFRRHFVEARSLAHGVAIATGILAVALPLAQAKADTLATFEWVKDSGTGTDPESGTLVIDLPGTVTASTFTDGTASLASIKSLSYTFSSGTAVTLSNVKSSTFVGQWETSTANATGGSGAPDLISEFLLYGTTPTQLSLVETQGLPTNVQAASYQYNGVSDSGVWQLESLTPVPLPAGLPLLLSGLGLLGMNLRRRPASVAV